MHMLVWGLGRVVWLLQLLGQWEWPFLWFPGPWPSHWGDLGVMSPEETLSAITKTAYAS